MKYNLSAKDIARFWNKVAIAGPEECWFWKACVQKQYSHRYLPYGFFGYVDLPWARSRPKKANNIRQLMAHRVSYALTHGEIPDGLHVMHTCDRANCVNPAHLRAGTHQENMRDMMQKGRRGDGKLWGENHHSCKYSSALIAEARKLYADGMRKCDICRKLGIKPTTVYAVLSGKGRPHG